MSDLRFDSSDDELDERGGAGISACGPLRIDWLKLPANGSYSTAIAITSLPGCRFRSSWRNLRNDIEQLREADIQEIFVLCTRGELIKYRTPELLPLYEEAGFTLHHWPIQDGSVPAMDDLLHLLHDVQVTFFSGAKILIHCFGGLGRACLVAACLLLQLDASMPAETAIEKLRNLRGPGAIQTVKQYNFICDFRLLRDEYLMQSNRENPRALSR